MSKGGGGETTTVQQADPWAGIQPYLTDIYRRAQQQSYNIPSYYPGTTNAPLNPMQLAGMGGLLGYSGYTSPYSQAGMPTYGYQNVSGSQNYPSTIQSTPIQPGGGADYFGNLFGGSSGGVFDALNRSVMGYLSTSAGQNTGSPSVTGGTTEGGTTQPYTINPYSYGTSLPGLINNAQGAWYGAINPQASPAQQIGAALTPETYQAISSAMSGMGISQPVYAPEVGVNPYAPQVNQNVYTPQIGFNPSTPYMNQQVTTPQIGTTNVPVPMDFYGQMMSGQVNPDIYTPLAEAATQRMIDPFLQQVLPAIRDEGIMTGAYGGSRQDLATIGATDTLQQNIADMLTNMYGGAYTAASQQQTEGARLATEAGLGIGQLGSTQNIEQARLGLGAQELASNIGQANLSSALQTQQLAGQLGTSQAQLGMEAQQLASTLGLSNADMQMRAQELASQVGSQNASLVMQAQQMALTGRQEEAAAMLEAAGLSRDLITQSGTLSTDQMQNQLAALSMAPQMAQMGMLPYQNMMDVGNILQGQTQGDINSALQAYLFNQQAPWASLNNYSGILGGVSTPYNSTSTTDTGSNPLANALGTGASTYGLYSMGLMNPSFAIGLPILSYLMS